MGLCEPIWALVGVSRLVWGLCGFLQVSVLPESIAPLGLSGHLGSGVVLPVSASAGLCGHILAAVGPPGPRPIWDLGIRGSA